MTNPSKAASLAMLQALANYIDQGSNNATFVFYEDNKPASVDTAANSSAKLVTLTLPKPSLKQLNANDIELNSTDAATVIKTGTAVWARLYSGSGAAVADFAVGTDITLSSASLKLGGTLSLPSIIFEPPV